MLGVFGKGIARLAKQSLALDATNAHLLSLNRYFLDVVHTAAY